MKTISMLCCTFLLAACGGLEEFEQETAALTSSYVRYGDSRVLESTAGGHVVQLSGEYVWAMSVADGPVTSASQRFNLVAPVGPLDPTMGPFVLSTPLHYGATIALQFGTSAYVRATSPSGLVIHASGRSPSTTWRVVYPAPGRHDPEVVCGAPFALRAWDGKYLTKTQGTWDRLQTRSPTITSNGDISPIHTWSFPCGRPIPGL